MDDILGHTQQIKQMLDILKNEFVQSYGNIPWANDVSERVFTLSKGGKLLRGGLVILGAQIAGKKVTKQTLRLAALMELLHTGLLIHDDIIDEDSIRRGDVSIHAQYELFAEERKMHHAGHVGVGLGICVGNILFFFVYERALHFLSPETLAFLSEELVKVGLGQMKDIYSYDLSVESIIELYAHKTGRYSFSLPLLLGLTQGKKADLYKETILAFGMSAGALYQLSDDLLGLYGSEEGIGKPIGSDIKVGKHTLYRYLLSQKVSKAERKKLDAFIGQPISKDDIFFVQQLCKKYGVLTQIAGIQESLYNQAESEIMALPIANNYKNSLLSLLTFISERKK